VWNVRSEPVATASSTTSTPTPARWRSAPELPRDASIDELAAQVVARRVQGVAAGGRARLAARAFLLSDLAALLAAALVSQAVAVAEGAEPILLPLRAGLLLALSAPVWLLLVRLYGLHLKAVRPASHSTIDELGSLVLLASALAWIVTLASLAVAPGTADALSLAAYWLALAVTLFTWRAMARAVVRRQVAYLQNTVIVGTGSVARRMAGLLLRHPDFGVNLLGFVPPADGEVPRGLEQAVVCANTEELVATAQHLGVERAILTLAGSHQRQSRSVVRDLSRAGVTVDVALELSEVLSPETFVHSVEGLPLLSLPPAVQARRFDWVKRTLDLAVAAIVMLLFAPVFAFTAVAVLLDSRGPVIYRHRRVGKGGRAIEVLKFRTMRLDCCTGERYGGDAAERMLKQLMEDPERAQEFEGSQKLSDDPRVTRIGRFLRKTSLDELPQLLNVLTGDLSLVGPRPITTEELTRYGTHAEELLSVRPGVTGYWQINGRSILDYDERIRLDLAYVSGRSLRLDFEILAKTARVVLARGGAV
jgi:exopolysaccharide biosynthesis polyprenyl glycosylphosphotransferase